MSKKKQFLNSEEHIELYDLMKGKVPLEGIGSLKADVAEFFEKREEELREDSSMRVIKEILLLLKQITQDPVDKDKACRKMNQVTTLSWVLWGE
jgi:hypothetical protein